MLTNIFYSSKLYFILSSIADKHLSVHYLLLIVQIVVSHTLQIDVSHTVQIIVSHTVQIVVSHTVQIVVSHTV
jgi:hypothetical protein